MQIHLSHATASTPPLRALLRPALFLALSEASILHQRMRYHCVQRSEEQTLQLVTWC